MSHLSISLVSSEFCVTLRKVFFTQRLYQNSPASSCGPFACVLIMYVDIWVRGGLVPLYPLQEDGKLPSGLIMSPRHLTPGRQKRAGAPHLWLEGVSSGLPGAGPHSGTPK